MTNPFNEIANLLRQKEERKRLEQEKLEEERRRIEEENEKFISLYEPMICRVLNQLGGVLWSSSWQTRDIKYLQSDPGWDLYDQLPNYSRECFDMEDFNTHIHMQKISGQIIRCQYLYGSIDDNSAIYAVGFQQIENRLIDSLVIASGTVLKDGYYRPQLNAEKLVIANENCLVKALTEIVKSRYNL
jgi:hypothetical protein